jgi:hypothetical protein
MPQRLVAATVAWLLLGYILGSPNPRQQPLTAPLTYTLKELLWSEEYGTPGLPDSVQWTYDVGGWSGKKGIDQAAFPQQMLVDYVRFYTLRQQ